MTNDVVAQARSFLIRGLAVVVVVLTYVWGSLTATVLSAPGVTGLLSAAGISSFMLTTTSTPADAWRGRRRRRRRRWRGGRWWWDWDPWD
jgi:hypothetical protein